MKSPGSYANRKQVSVPGLSLLILLAFASVGFLSLLTWFSAASLATKSLVVAVLLGCLFLRTVVVSVSLWNSLMVLSDGMRDTYLPPEAVVAANLRSVPGPFSVLIIAHTKKFHGLTWTQRVLTLVWSKTAADTLEQVRELLAAPVPLPAARSTLAKRPV
jgi:hypothetical protein